MEGKLFLLLQLEPATLYLYRVLLSSVLCVCRQEILFVPTFVSQTYFKSEASPLVCFRELQKVLEILSGSVCLFVFFGSFEENQLINSKSANWPKGGYF